MPVSFYPSQIGFVPTGVNGTVQVSTTVIGRTITGSYEGVGFGAGGRPDYVELVQINLTKRASDGTLTQKGTITMNVNDIVAIAGVPSNLSLTLKEIQVCESSVLKKAVVLMSQTYT